MTTEDRVLAMEGRTGEDRVEGFTVSAPTNSSSRKSHPQKNTLTSILESSDAFVYFDPEALGLKPADIYSKTGSMVLRVRPAGSRRKPTPVGSASKYPVHATVQNLRAKEAFTGHLYYAADETKAPKVTEFTIPWGAIWGVRPAVFGSQGTVWPTQAPVSMMIGSTAEEITARIQQTMWSLTPPGDQTPPGLVVFNEDVVGVPTPYETLRLVR